jgi:hypothetical protein
LDEKETRPVDFFFPFIDANMDLTHLSIQLLLPQAKLLFKKERIAFKFASITLK